MEIKSFSNFIKENYNAAEQNIFAGLEPGTIIQVMRDETLPESKLPVYLVYRGVEGPEVFFRIVDDEYGNERTELLVTKVFNRRTRDVSFNIAQPCKWILNFKIIGMRKVDEQ